eukprot:TRINITY_DN138_c0_g1_i13.p1 TRINITY_DN138_c0_g1~~TRINITY_DN138_c0_g1_i13.p1  ORF type:complete len:481 (-),score=122.79 TRINITY_DN138_c0_g1_i13:45-1487(-)
MLSRDTPTALVTSLSLRARPMAAAPVAGPCHAQAVARGAPPKWCKKCENDDALTQVHTAANEERVGIVAGSVVACACAEEGLSGPTGIVVRDGVIERVAALPPESASQWRQCALFDGCARVIDLARYCVLPGLIDCHVHVMIEDDDYQVTHLKYNSAYKALRAQRTLRRMLQCGWTTVRVAGDADVGYGVTALQQAAQEGLIVAPRMVCAAHYICSTGGGGDLALSEEQRGSKADGLIVDGVEEMRKAVRKEVKYGSQWIKLLATGAFMKAQNNPNTVQFSPEELKMAVEEAKRLGIPVMAHAHSATGIKECLLAGVASVEHGTFLDDECIDLFVQTGAYLIPTIYIGDYYIEKGDTAAAAQHQMVEISKQARAVLLENVRKAAAAGVRVCCGTDYVGWPLQQSAREIACLAEAGLTPIEAIRAATSRASALLHMDKLVGSIEEGKAADLIAVLGDPLHDLHLLEDVKFVMKGGAVVVQP